MAVVRWTDEMVDALAGSMAELRQSVMAQGAQISEQSLQISEQGLLVAQLRESVSELREDLSAILRAFVEEHEDNRRKWQQYEEWKKETDQRFNVLLEEVRTSNRRIDRLENQD